MGNPYASLTEMQRRVAMVWLQVINAPEDVMNRLASQTTFTEAGITSVNIAKLQREIFKEFGIKVKAVQLFKLSTLEAQADFIQQALLPAQRL